MISGPPGITNIVRGITYAINLSVRRVHPNSDAHPSDSAAIAQAIWFRYIITVLSVALVLDFDPASTFILILLIYAIDALSYPVVSHIVLHRAGLGKVFPSFITAFTWLGNLRVLLGMILGQLSSILSVEENILIIMFPLAIWMIWASWSVATLALGRGGWAGAGMVLLALVLEMVLTAMIVIYVLPAQA
jgi:hypothetical protein